MIDFCNRDEFLQFFVSVSWVFQYSQYSFRGVLRNELLENLVSKYKKTYTQIALNWLLSKPNVITLSKETKKSHIDKI